MIRISGTDTTSNQDLGVDDASKIKNSDNISTGAGSGFSIPKIDLGIKLDNNNNSNPNYSNNSQQDNGDGGLSINIDTTPVTDLTNAVIKYTTDTGNALVDSTVEAANQLYETTNNFFKPIVEPVIDTTEKIGETIEQTAKPVIEDVSNTVTDTASSIEQTVKPVAEQTEQIVKPIIDNAASVVEDAASAAEQTIKPVVEQAAEAGKEILSTIGDTIAPAAETLVNASKPVIDYVTSTLTPVAEYLGQSANSLIDGAMVKAGDGNNFGEISIGDGAVIDISNKIEDSWNDATNNTILANTSIKDIYNTVNNPEVALGNITSDYISNNIIDLGKTGNDIISGTIAAALDGQITGKEALNIATNAVISSIPVIGQLYSLYNIGKAIWDATNGFFGLDKSVAEGKRRIKSDSENLQSVQNMLKTINVSQDSFNKSDANNQKLIADNQEVYDSGSKFIKENKEAYDSFSKIDNEFKTKTGSSLISEDNLKKIADYETGLAEVEKYKQAESIYDAAVKKYMTDLDKYRGTNKAQKIKDDHKTVMINFSNAKKDLTYKTEKELNAAFKDSKDLIDVYSKNKDTIDIFTKNEDYLAYNNVSEQLKSNYDSYKAQGNVFVDNLNALNEFNMKNEAMIKKINETKSTTTAAKNLLSKQKELEDKAYQSFINPNNTRLWGTSETASAYQSFTNAFNDIKSKSYEVYKEMYGAIA